MDRLDEQILGILTDNARCSLSEIGRQVGLSTNAAAARVRRLEDDGIILGYTVVTGQDAPELRGGLESSSTYVSTPAPTTRRSSPPSPRSSRSSTRCT